MKQKYLLKFTAVCLIIFTGLSLAGLKCPPGSAGGDQEKITLKWWRVNFDESADLQKMISSFKSLHPNINVELRTFTYEEYEAALLDAISASTAEENKGPDIISIHDDWLPRWASRLAPLPASDKTYQHLTLREFQDTFVQTVADELTDRGQIYAVPLSVDTLALYYNKDLLDSAGISQPPKSWGEFSESVKKLTKVKEGVIAQSGAAIGTSTNINRSTDILELIMLQNGTKMIDDSHRQMMLNSPAGASSNVLNPGEVATAFYTDFANAKKEVYTWNLNQHYSIDAFVAGETAMMFNYSFRQATVEKKSPNLNYGISYMPQIDPSGNKINYPNYWAEAVSNKTKYLHQSWQFVEYLANKDNMKAYYESTLRPPSRRDLIDEFKNTPVKGIFCEQALTARSWWKPDSGQMEIIFAKMIESINLGKNTVPEALAIAQQSAQQLIKK